MLSNDQAKVATAALEAGAEQGLALAGSSALMAHGLVDRPTQDVDLFLADLTAFDRSVEAAISSWQAAGFDVISVRRSPSFARFVVATGSGETSGVEVDVALDWRSDPPVTTAYGPTLSLRDAVASKVDALYGRNAPRDRYDVAAILKSGVDPEAILAWVKERDPGVDDRFLLEALRTPPRRGEVDPAAWTDINHQLGGWADRIERDTTRSAAFPEPSPVLDSDRTAPPSRPHDPGRGPSSTGEVER